MLDIGFWELVLIGVVALFVVGPERFPGMIKKAGYWVGQFRRIASSVKSEIQLEVDKADQLQTKLEEQKEIFKRSIDMDNSTPAVKRKSVEEVEAKLNSTDSSLADSTTPNDVKSAAEMQTVSDVSTKHEPTVNK